MIQHLLIHEKVDQISASAIVASELYKKVEERFGARWGIAQVSGTQVRFANFVLWTLKETMWRWAKWEK